MINTTHLAMDLSKDMEHNPILRMRNAIYNRYLSTHRSINDIYWSSPPLNREAEFEKKHGISVKMSGNLKIIITLQI